jgi:hypothetical protein
MRQGDQMIFRRGPRPNDPYIEIGRGTKGDAKQTLFERLIQEGEDVLWVSVQDHWVDGMQVK